MKKNDNPINRILRHLSRSLNILGMAALFASMCLTVVDVISRYLFANPVFGSVELTEFFMVVLGFSSLSWCAMNRGHAEVDLFMSRLSKRKQATVGSFIYFLCLTIVLLVSYQGFIAGDYQKKIENYSFLLEIPTYPFYFLLAINFGVLSLVIFSLFVSSIKEAMGK